MGRSYVISGSQSTIWSSDLSACILEAFESLLLAIVVSGWSKAKPMPILCTGLKLTGDVTSWTRCRSFDQLLSAILFIETMKHKERENHTDVEKNCAIKLLVNNVCREDLVVKSLRSTHGSRHFDDRGRVERES